jgi:glutaredoxin
MSPAIEKVRKFNDRYVVFYDTGCPFSEQAIELLQSKGVSYKAYRISDFTTLPTLVAYFGETSKETGFLPTHKTKPIVFYKGKFVGGARELKNKLQ